MNGVTDSPKVPPPKFKITVHRLESGIWAEDEYKEVGKKDDGTPEYGVVPVTKHRARETVIFSQEFPNAPDVVALTKLLNREPKQPVAPKP